MDDILKNIKYEHDPAFEEEKEDKFPPEFIKENQEPPDWYWERIPAEEIKHYPGSSLGPRP